MLRSSVLSIGIFIFVLLIIGCRPNEDYVIYNPKKIDTSKVTLDTVSTTRLSVPSLICITDTKLVVLDDQTSMHFNVFDKFSLEYVGSFGAREGPGSFDVPFTYCQNIRDTILIIDVDKLYRIDLNNINSIDWSYSVLPDKLPPFKDIYFLADTAIVGSIFQGDEIIFKYSLVDSTITLGKLRPYVPYKYGPNIAGLLFQGSLAYLEDYNIFSLSYFLFNRIDFWQGDLTLNGIMAYSKKQTDFPVFKESVPIAETLHYFGEQRADKWLIAVEYYGKPWQSLSNINSIVHLVSVTGESYQIDFPYNITSFDIEVMSDSLINLLVLYDDGNKHKIGRHSFFLP